VLGRNPGSLMQRLMLFAILGILFSVVMPNVQRAKQRGGPARQPAVERQPGADSVDGQNNTIDVSETAESPDGEPGGDWGRAVARIIPIAIIVGILALARRRLGRA
jgi:hypothetical protein